MGSKLTKALIEVAQSRQIKEIHGDVSADSVAVAPFVEGLGFEIRLGKEPHLLTIVRRIEGRS